MAKKYYWLKLMKDFFQQPKIKKLRRVAGGDTYTVIYLKLQLLSLENGGKLYFEGVEETFVEEIALTIDEDEDNVRFTLMYLEQQGLLEKIEDNEYAMPETMARIGSESESAERVRQYRERQRQAEALPPAPDNPPALHCNNNVRTCNTDIYIESDSDLYTESESREKSVYVEQSAREAHADTNTQSFPPSPEDVQAYCKEIGSGIDAKYFHAYYTAKKWKSGKTPIEDWKAYVRLWECNNSNRTEQAQQNSRNETEADDASGYGW